MHEWAKAPFWKDGKRNPMKKAILLVSYGVASHMAWEKTLGILEAEIRNRWTGWDMYQAFTGRRIIEKWQEQGFGISNETEILDSLVQKEYERIIVLPTHLTFGKEYTRVVKAVESIKTDRVRVHVGLPLLGSRDLRIGVADAIIKELNLSEKEEAVYVGHGTLQNENTVYEMLEEELRKEGQTSAIVCTLGNIDKALKRIQKKSIRLIPVVLTAGKHALRDITGDETGSVAKRLRGAGFEVTVVEKGLGEYRSIRKVYMEQLDELINS